MMVLKAIEIAGDTDGEAVKNHPDHQGFRDSGRHSGLHQEATARAWSLENFKPWIVWGGLQIRQTSG